MRTNGTRMWEYFRTTTCINSETVIHYASMQKHIDLQTVYLTSNKIVKRTGRSYLQYLLLVMSFRASNRSCIIYSWCLLVSKRNEKACEPRSSFDTWTWLLNFCEISYYPCHGLRAAVSLASSYLHIMSTYVGVTFWHNLSIAGHSHYRPPSPKPNPIPKF